MARPRRIDDASLLATARATFLEQGVGASTREIARRAGVSEGVLFQRYGTKADLFFAALASAPADVSAIVPEVAGEAPVREQLETASLGMLDYFRAATPALLTAVAHPAFDARRFFEGRAPASLESWMAGLVGYLEAETRAGRIHPSAPTSFASLLTAALFGLAVIETIGVHGAPLQEQAVRGLVEALCEGLAPRSVRNEADASTA